MYNKLIFLMSNFILCYNGSTLTITETKIAHNYIVHVFTVITCTQVDKQ